MEAFAAEAGSSSLGQEFLSSPLGQFGSIGTSWNGSLSTGSYSLTDILSGAAAGSIRDIYLQGNPNATDLAFQWWQQQLPNVSNRLVAVSKGLEPFVYNKAKSQYEADYPGQSANMEFADFVKATESDASMQASGQSLLDAGFTGFQIADINDGPITIGDQNFVTSEQHSLDVDQSIEQLQIELQTAEDELSALQLEFFQLQDSGAATQEELEQLQTDFDTKSQELGVLQQQEADRQAQVDADLLQQQENEQFILDNNLSSEHFSLTPEEQERDLFISQSQQFLDLEGAKADLLTQKQLFDALESDTNATQEDKDVARGSLNTSLATLIQAGLSIGVPIGQILSSDDVTGAVANQSEDVGVQFRPQTPDLKIAPTLGPSFSNTAGLLGGGGGFTTAPSTTPKFQELPIAKAPNPTFNQFEDTFNPTVTASGFSKPKSLLNTGNSNSLGLLQRRA